MSTVPKDLPVEVRADFSSHGFSTGKRLDLDEVLAQMLADGLIVEDDAKRTKVARSSARNDVHPMVLIANAKFNDARNPEQQLSLETLMEWLAARAGLPYLRIDPTKIDVAKVGQVVAPSYAARYRILPIAIGEHEVSFATSEPFDDRWVADLARMLRREVQRVVANPLDVNRYLMEFYGVTKSVKQARHGKDGKGEKSDGGILPNFEQLIELGKSGDVAAEDSHVVRIVDWLLQYAYEQRASDIHMEPRREVSGVRFRIDGVLHKVFEVPTPVMLAVISRVKILGRLDIAERRRPQDGRIKTRSPGGREVEMRLSTMPTAFGEKVVLRIFDPDVVVKGFAELGFGARDEAAWRDMVERPHGIVLVTGPTGSGKTTTLYACLNILNEPDVKIITTEDPVEFQIDRLIQCNVNDDVGLTFARCLRSILRQDPDIVMVGEIRDLETAQIAVEASLTGHLVLSTLHTNSAPETITRLLDMDVEPFLIAASLEAVLAQRLCRKVCRFCKEAYVPDEKEMEELGIPAAWSRDPKFKLFRAKGCVNCEYVGYNGRTGLYEMVSVDEGIRDLVLESATALQLRRYCRKHLGMMTLREVALMKAVQGITTASEVLYHTDSYED